MSLEGTAALITGGSRGLGRALAEKLADAGVRVVIAARGAAELAPVVDAIVGRGGQAWAVEGDVGAPEDATRIAAFAQGVTGGIDLLVNNASTLGQVPLPELLDTSAVVLERTLAVNLLGPFRLIQALAGPMLVRGGGTIVNISSDAAVEAYPGWGAYSASKAALDHLSRVLAEELTGTGIRVLAVDPGEMDTAMHAAALPDADPAELARPSDVARRLVRLIEEPPRAVRVAA